MKNIWHIHYRVDFEPRDIWIGVYLAHKEKSNYFSSWRFYVCLIPMLPILIYVERMRLS